MAGSYLYDRMSFFLTEDRSTYRKWVNGVASALLPGSGHFLSGRREAGVMWFITILIIWIAGIVLYVSPVVPSLIPLGVAWLVRFLLWVAIVADSCRKPIPRKNFGIWAVTLVLAATWWIFPSFFVWRFVARSFSIPSAAMTPTLMGNRKASNGRVLKGDEVIVNEWTYHFHAPQRGDVVVFRTDAISHTAREQFQIPPHEAHVKRLVGLPGERVSIRPPNIYINGEKLLQPAILKNMFQRTNELANIPGGELKTQPDEIQLGPNEFYVVGDNIMNSLDSRYYGPIKGGHFIGKAAWIFWPPDREGFVQ